MTTDYNMRLVIDRFGNDYHLANKNHMSYCCPFCAKRRGKEDKSYKLYVSYEKLKYYCFKCHAKGSLVSHVESSYLIYNDLMEYMKDSDAKETEEDNVFYVPNVRIPSNSEAYNYCVKRGITDYLIDRYDIRFGIDNLFGRIVVPNITYGNRKIWTDIYSARSYINQTPKYYMPEDCNKNNIVFNLHNISDGCDNIFINEGVITSIFAGETSVAVFGSKPSEKQLSLISSKKAKNYYCTLDGDAAGRLPNQNMAESLSKKIGKESNIYFVNMPEDRDAADMGNKVYLEYVMDSRILYNNVTYSKLYSYFE